MNSFDHIVRARVLHINKPQSYKDSNHVKIVASARQGARGEPVSAIGVTLLMASRWMSRSTVAKRFVVLMLAWPNHWLIVAMSTPDFRR